MKLKGSWRFFAVLMAAIFFGTVLISCATTGGGQPWSKQKKGTAWGAGAGAVLGGVAGALASKKHRGLGALIGGAAGAAIGGLAGNQIGAYMDRQQQEFEEALAQERVASVVREQENLRLTLKGDAFFKTNSAEILPQVYPSLDKTADILSRYPQTIIEVGGHADPRGADDYNLALSLKRADAVCDYLVARGVDPARLRSVGYGETQLKSGGNPDLFAQDRRVEIKIMPIHQG